MAVLSFTSMTAIAAIIMFTDAGHVSYLNRFATNGDLNEKTCKADDILFEYEDVSILQCALKCQVTSRCAGFSYNTESNTCIGCGNQYVALIFDPEDFRTETGSKYYKGDWTNYGGILYSFDPYQKPFYDAAELCLNRSAFLARIDSDEKLTFLNESTSVFTTWIGLTDEGHNGVWTWVNDNSTTNFTNWAPIFPYDNDEHNCALASRTYGMKWQSSVCSFTLGTALCQRGLN